MKTVLVPCTRVTTTSQSANNTYLQFFKKIESSLIVLQVQWYYMIRNPLDNSFDNFTILANEVATVDPRKYRVWTPSPNIYSLKVWF